MAATLSSSGTWTTLSTDLTKIQDTQSPPAINVTINPVDLATIPDEIRQMILLVQAGFGAQLGAGKRLDFWAAARILVVMLQAYMGIGATREGNFPTEHA